MKNSVITVIVASLASVAATAGFFLTRSDPATTAVKKLEAEVQAARDEAGRLKIERDQLVADVKKATPKAANFNDPAPLPLPAAAKPGATKVEDAAAGAALRKKISDPDTRDTLRKTQGVTIDMTYGTLFQKLNLNGEELDNFKRLLGDQLSAKTELSLKMADPSLSDAERKALRDQFIAGKQRSETDIRKFLNNEDDYSTYQQWSDTQPERMMLQLGSSAFDNAGAPLSDEQREQLVNTMAGVRKSPSPAAGLNDPRNITAESLTPDGIAKQLERHREDNARVRDEAAKYLSPQQMEALKRMQDQMLAMIEAGMKTTGQMFGSGKK